MHNEFYSARRRLALTQKQVAELCGIDRRMLSRYERGERSPSAATAARLGQILGIRGLEFAPPRNLGSEIRRRMRLRHGAASKAQLSAAWKRVCEQHSSRLGISSPVPRWFAAEVPPDSDAEVLAILQLLAAGARFTRENPHALDFRAHSVLDRSHVPLGRRRLPCLHLRLPGLEFLYFPQVTLRVGAFVYRLDALVIVRLTRGSSFACAVELDGNFRDPARDALRTERLGIPVYRFGNAVIQSYLFVDELTRTLRDKAKRKVG